MNCKRRIERLERLAAERQRQAPAVGRDVFADIRAYTEALARGEPLPDGMDSWLEPYDAEFAVAAARHEQDRIEEQITAEDLLHAGFTLPTDAS